MKENTAPKSSKNYAVEFWRFFLCMTFMLIHVFMIYPVMYWNIAPYVTDSGKVLFSGAMDIIIIFYIISGYFLMRSYRKRKLQRKDEKTTPAKEAWGYLSKRLKGLYPAFLIALVFGLVLSNIYRDIPIQDWLFTAIDSIWEFLGTIVTGLGIGNNAYGLYTDGMHALMNGPLWFISAIFIVGYLVYYLLEKNEDAFLGLIAPFGFLIAYGYFHLNGISPMWYNTMAGGYLNQAFVQAFVCMGLGCLFYVAIEKINSKPMSTKMKWLLTIVQLICAGIIIYHTLFSTKFYFTTIHAIAAIMTFLTLLNKDYITKLLNHKIWHYPGKLALYIYMLHFPIIGVLYKVFNITNLLTLGIVTVIITIVLSIIMMIVVDEFITPALMKPKKEKLTKAKS